MKVMMIGDVVARPGRMAVLDRVQDLREQNAIDMVVMNAENVAGGFSITQPIADELFANGIDVMTSGNHIFDKREIIPYIEKQPRLLRPANYPPQTPGRGIWTGTIKGISVSVINIMGRVFMPPVDDPFRVVDELVRALPETVKVRLVDVHAEATSEKVALGRYLDGRTSAVVGTHTHVQTADERILPQGTAYLTDLGMTGSYAGVIGMDAAETIARFTTVTSKRTEHSTGDVRICAAIIDIDETTGRAREISRLSVSHQQ